jgi:hypothetical protein
LRVANLNMDEKGEVTGTIKLTFIGASAVRWRHAGLSGDDESLKHGLRTHLEDMVPKSLEVKVSEIVNLSEYEEPLNVTYEVKGRLGTATGKRLIMPSDVFVAGSSAIFHDEQRVQPVYFHYPQATQDAVRINVPEGFDVEAVPAEAKYDLPKQEIYTYTVAGDPKGFTSRRTHAQGELIVMPKDYDDLRKFYSQLESKDQESVVVKVAPVTAAASGGN